MLAASSEAAIRSTAFMKASAPSSSAARLIQDLVSEAKWLLASGVSAVQASSAHCRARSRHSLGSPGMLASFATPYIPRRKSIPKRLMCPNWVRSSYGVVHAAAALCRGARAIVPESKSRGPRSGTHPNLGGVGFGRRPFTQSSPTHAPAWSENCPRAAQYQK